MNCLGHRFPLLGREERVERSSWALRGSEGNASVSSHIGGVGGGADFRTLVQVVHPRYVLIESQNGGLFSALVALLRTTFAYGYHVVLAELGNGIWELLRQNVPIVLVHHTLAAGSSKSGALICIG